MTQHGARPAPAFALTDAGRAYGATVALAPLRLEIAAGETVAVVGPSGAGKTTLLHLLAGVIRPVGGSVRIHGRSLDAIEPGRELSRLVGVIHQQYDLVPSLSVVRNVLAGRLGEWSLWRALAAGRAPRAPARARRARAGRRRGRRAAARRARAPARAGSARDHR